MIKINCSRWYQLILIPILFQIYSVRGQNINLNDTIAVDSSITKGILPNGLTYYIKPNPKPAQKLELRLLVKAGSILEDPDQQGLAHFMEHMNFNGLKHFPKNKLIDYLQKIGVQLGADLNANTDWDRTYFILPIPTENAENVDLGFQILADWAGGATIASDEVENERHVILEESRMSTKNASTRMLHQYLPELVNKSRYAYRLPIGLDSIISNSNAEKIKQFYHDWYRPDLEAIFVVGDITVSKAKSLIEKYLSSLKNPVPERKREFYTISPYSQTKSKIVTDSESTNYVINMTYSFHKVNQEKTLLDFNENLIRTIMLNVLNRKLHDIAQSPNPPYNYAYVSFNNDYSLYDEALNLEISPINNIKLSIDTTIYIIKQAIKYGLDSVAIDMCKKQYLAFYENAYKERESSESASFIREFFDNYMKGTPMPGAANTYKYLQKLLPRITTLDINNSITKWLQIEQPYFALITGPENGKISLPTQQGLIQMINHSYTQNIRKPNEKKRIISLLTNDPKPGKIIGETIDKMLGTRTYTLSNGIKVTVKKTDFKSDEILFSGIKLGGGNYYKAVDKANYTFATDIIESMGFGQLTPTDIHDYLSDKSVDLDLDMEDLTCNVSGKSSVKDLKTLLQVNYLKLTEPRKDTGLFKGFITKGLSNIQSLGDNPQYAFQDSLNKVLYHDDLRTPIYIPTINDLNKIDLNRVLEIYKEQFGNANGFNFYFVGNINEDTLKSLIGNYIASLPVHGKTPSIKDNGLRPINYNKFFKFFKGKDQKTTLLTYFHGNLNYSEDLQLKAEILARAMTIQLIDTLREKMQLIYRGNGFAQIEEYPYGHYSFGVTMPCGPENVNKILEELNKEFNNYKSNGISEIDLEKVKKAMFEQHKDQIKQNYYWIEELKNIYFWKRDTTSLLNFDKIIENINNKDLIPLLNKLLDGTRFTAVSYPMNFRSLR